MSMSMSKQGQKSDKPVAIVAGASRGIGEATARRFESAGWRVAALSRSISEAETAGRLDIRANLTDPAGGASAVDKVLGTWGRIDAVIHSVGDIAEGKPVYEQEWSSWAWTLEVCLGSAVHLTCAASAAVVKAGGVFLYISSVAARRPYAGIAPYCAAKAALNSYARSVALELAPNARANVISPAVVNTDLFHRSPFTEEQAAGWHLLNRIGKPGEVAELAYSCATNTWLTGQELILDGGMSLR